MHQYQLHACVLDDWGMGLLATKMRAEMQEEPGHSEEYLNRLLFLKGESQLPFAKTPVCAQSLKELFEICHGPSQSTAAMLSKQTSHQVQRSGTKWLDAESMCQTFDGIP